MLLRRIVALANNVGYDYDLRVEITEEKEEEDWVKIKTVNEDDETELTATVCVFSEFECTDPIEKITFNNILLGVWVDGDSDSQPWRIIDARATSLFALLYI